MKCAGNELVIIIMLCKPLVRFDNGAGPAVIRGDKQLELNKWHTVKLVRSKLNGESLQRCLWSQLKQETENFNSSDSLKND